MKRKLKKFLISFDMSCSHEFRVKAKNVTNAKNKAFKRFERIRNKKSSYNVDVDDDPFWPDP